jgi:hypothetical protein
VDHDGTRNALQGLFRTQPREPRVLGLADEPDRALIDSTDVTNAFTTCTTTSRVVRCQSPDHRSYVTIKVVGADPLVHRFKFRLKNLSLTGPFDGPATVTLTYDSIDRVGVISDCQVRASGLLCRQF